MMRRAVPILALVLAAGAATGAEKSIEEFVPADALAAVVYYGSNPDIGKTALAQLMAEQEVQDWLVTVRQAVQGVNQLAAGFLRVNPAQLKPLLGSDLAIAVMASPAAPGPPQVLLVARVGEEGEASHQNVKAFLGQLTARFGGEAGKIPLDEMELTRLGGPMGAGFGFRDGYLFLSTSPEAIKRALAPGTPKLAAHAGFKRASAASGSPVFLLHYDHTELMERFGEMMGPQVKAALGGLGLDQVRTAGLRIGARDRALVSTLFLHTEGERKGIVKAFAASPVDTSLLRLAPRDAAVAWVSNLDGAELYATLLATLEALGQAGDPDLDLRAGIAEFEKTAGISFRDDLFGSLGRGTVITTSGKSLLPALIVSQPVKDAERFEGALTKLVAQLDALVKAEQGENAGAVLRPITFGDHTIRYLAMPGVPVPVAPCFARHGDRMVFALTPIHLKDYLAFLDAGEPSVLDNPGYQALAKVVPKGATSVSYSDFGENFVQFYTTLGPLLTLAQGIPNNPVAVDFSNLPSARTIRKHMFGSISYAYATDDLIVHETHSPMGFGLIGPLPSGGPGLAIAGVGAGMLVPALARARGQARHVQSMNNLRQLTLGMIMYAQDQGGELPPSLDALIEKGMLEDGKVLVAAGDPNPPARPNRRPSSYVYFLDDHAGVKIKLEAIENPAQTPVAWERQPFFRGRRNVAFADGHVQSMMEQEFQQALARLRALLKPKPGDPAEGHL